jgi:hypothetical protein
LEKLSAKVADRKRAEEKAKAKGAESVWEAYLRRKKEKKKEKLRQKVRVRGTETPRSQTWPGHACCNLVAVDCKHCTSVHQCIDLGAVGRSG